jgi:hypothetical protein
MKRNTRPTAVAALRPTTTMSLRACGRTKGQHPNVIAAAPADVQWADARL